MIRRKHKKDYAKKKPAKHWQGWAHPNSRELRPILKRLDVASGAMFKKIGTWFEWN